MGEMTCPACKEDHWGWDKLPNDRLRCKKCGYETRLVSKYGWTHTSIYILTAEECEYEAYWFCIETFADGGKNYGSEIIRRMPREDIEDLAKYFSTALPEKRKNTEINGG